MPRTHGLCCTLVLAVFLTSVAGSTWSHEAVGVSDAVPWPTTTWQESTPKVQGMVLSAVLSMVTGASAADFAAQRLFKPLGISDFEWTADPQGISDAGGLSMQPRDMAKIGYLYLHNGKWQGQALLPPEWTDKVFHHATADMQLDKPSALRFSNGWWTKPDRHVIIAVGRNTDLIVVLPQLYLVAVVTGKSPFPFGPLINLLEGSVVSNLAMPANPKAYAELTHAVRRVATERSSPTPKLAESDRQLSLPHSTPARYCVPSHHISGLEVSLCASRFSRPLLLPYGARQPRC